MGDIEIINPLGSLYHNYKSYVSEVLMAVADSEYRFTYVHIGSYVKYCDSKNLRHFDVVIDRK